MSKTESMDFSDDRLLSLAASMIDDHNLIGALKILNKNAELNYNDDRSYMLYAEAYDDMGLYERSVNYWFRYLDEAPDGDNGDAFEGLAVNYMNLGNENFAAYYYNKMLVETEDLTPETRRDIIDSFLRKQENPLRFAWPPRLADYSAEISKGVECMRARRYDEAVAEFEKVADGNPRYLTARNYIAMCMIIADRCDEAEAECREILRRNPDDVQALTTLAAVKTEQKRAEDGREIALRLVRLNVSDPDDIYKIATVCCENGLHEQAYLMFCKLGGEFSYDTTVLYFKAISAYNCGRTEDSLAAFEKLLTINPDAVVARYYMLRVRRNIEEGKTEELGYFYRLPQEQREDALRVITEYCSLSVKEAYRYSGETDVLSRIKWSFDELESSDDNQLHLAAAMCAVKGGYDDYVRELLLNAFLADGLKIAILHDLCARNEDNRFGVVICNIYKGVDTYRLSVGRNKRKYFVQAYAALVSRFGIFEESYSSTFCRTAEELYARLEERGALSCAAAVKALSAAIFAISGVREAVVPEDDVCGFFEADRAAYDKIMEAGA